MFASTCDPLAERRPLLGGCRDASFAAPDSLQPGSPAVPFAAQQRGQPVDVRFCGPAPAVAAAIVSADGFVGAALATGVVSDLPVCRAGRRDRLPSSPKRRLFSWQGSTCALRLSQSAGLSDHGFDV